MPRMTVSTALAATDFGDITQIIVYLVLAAASVLGSILSQKKQQGEKPPASRGGRAPAGTPPVAREPRPSQQPAILTRGTELPRSVPTQPERSTEARPLRREPPKPPVPGVPAAAASPQVRARIRLGRLKGRISQREPLVSRLNVSIHARPGIRHRITRRPPPGHLHDETEPREEHHVHISPETGRQRQRTRARAGEVILELTRSPASLRSAVVLSELLAGPLGLTENDGPAKRSVRADEW